MLGNHLKVALYSFSKQNFSVASIAQDCLTEIAFITMEATRTTVSHEAITAAIANPLESLYSE